MYAGVLRFDGSHPDLPPRRRCQMRSVSLALTLFFVGQSAQAAPRPDPLDLVAGESMSGGRKGDNLKHPLGAWQLAARKEALAERIRRGGHGRTQRVKNHYF